METPLYYAARAMVGMIQILPLRGAALLGRLGGRAAFYLDGRHRRVALQNLRRVFSQEKKDAEIYQIALENFCRIGESYATALRTSVMSYEEARRYCDVIGLEKLRLKPDEAARENRVVAIGHFGNFELNAILARGLTGYQGATTYRGLRQPSLNRVMQNVRSRSGCLFFERRTDAGELRAVMSRKGIMLGLLADQHAGNGGIWLPFLGIECSTSAAPAVLALRYNCPLFTAVIFRVGLGRWRAEVGDEIPTQINGVPRPTADIALDMNRALEQAVRRDPANWFWVHKRWKPKPRRPDAPVSDELADKVPVSPAETFTA